jgi:DNA invertase Pin-like site-specific DNA recombinase
MFDIYLRVSQMNGREEDQATEIYESQCRDWAGRNAIEVGKVVEDLDVSGSVAVADRALEQLIRRVEDGESDGILTPYLDRFGRDLLEGAKAYRRIALAGGRLVCVSDGTDSNRPGDKLLFNMRMAIAEEALDRTRANYQASVDRAASRGVYVAMAPFGYRKRDDGKLEIVEPEAKVVRELFRRRGEGETLGSLHKWFRAEVARLPERRQGKRVYRGSRGAMRAALANRAYLGEMSTSSGTSGQPTVYKDRHPAIITSERVWEAAQGKAPFSPRNGKTLAAHLRGLVFCATCEHRCKISLTGPPERRTCGYTCTHPDCTGRASIKASNLDAHVEGLLSQAAADHEPHFAAVLLGDDRWTAALEKVEEARSTFEGYRDNMELQRQLGLQDFTAGLAVRKTALAAARTALAKLRPTSNSDPEEAPPHTAVEIKNLDSAANNARFIERVVLRPNGMSGLRKPPEERADVYFVGASEPYSPREVELPAEQADVLANLPPAEPIAA